MALRSCGSGNLYVKIKAEASGVCFGKLPQAIYAYLETETRQNIEI